MNISKMHFKVTTCAAVQWKPTFWFCWFSVVWVSTKDVHVEELSVSNKLKFDISNFLQFIYCKATFLMEFP